MKNENWSREMDFRKKINEMVEEGKIPVLLHCNRNDSYSIYPIVHKGIYVCGKCKATSFPSGKKSIIPEQFNIQHCGYDKDRIKLVKIINKRIYNKITEIDDLITGLQKKKYRLLKKNYPTLKPLTMRTAKHWDKNKKQMREEFGGLN